MGVSEQTVGSVFTPVSCTAAINETDRIGLQALTKTLPSPDNIMSLTSDLDHVTTSIDSLQEHLSHALEYVEKVLAGEVKGDDKIGKYLLDTISAVPKIDADSFESMFNNSLQDLLMVVYLANLTRTQVALQETLNTVL